MAVTSIWAVKGWLGKLVSYVENPDKTENPGFVGDKDADEEQRQGLSDVIAYAMDAKKTTKEIQDESIEILQRYVSGVNCAPSIAREEMLAVKRRFGKDEGVMAYHGYQSFAPGEATPAIAHEIGVKLAKQLWGNKYQVLVATHLDKKNHLHNHFVVNTVSFADGIRYHRTEQDYWEMRHTSDALCREYGLSVIEHPKPGRSKQYGEWRAEKEDRPTWLGIIKADVDEAISKSVTDRQFFYYLYQKGYFIKEGADITVRPPGRERGLKLARNFGEDYTREAINSRILAQMRIRQEPEPERKELVWYLSGSLKRTRKIGGLRGLYLHYCYCLGILPKNQSAMTPPRLHFLLKEDLLKLNQITKETRLLCTHRIDTSEQLLSYRKSLEEKIRELAADRKRLRYRIRSIQKTDKKQAEQMKAETASLSKQIGELGKEVGLCEGIMERSGVIKGKLQMIQQQKKEKEEPINDKRRRSGRSGR